MKRQVKLTVSRKASNKLTVSRESSNKVTFRRENEQKITFTVKKLKVFSEFFFIFKFVIVSNSKYRGTSELSKPFNPPLLYSNNV